MRTLVLLAALVLAVPGGIAEPAPEHIVAQLQQYPVISGKFVQTRQLQGLSRPIRSDGNFLFWRDHGLYWETLRPFYQATTFTADDVISWPAPEGPALASETNDRVQQYVSRILLSVFSADLSLIDKLFSSRWTVDGEHWSLELTPVNDTVGKVIERARLAGEHHLRQLQVATRNGDISTMDFAEVLAPAPLLPAQCARFVRQGELPCPAAAE